MRSSRKRGTARLARKPKKFGAIGRIARRIGSALREYWGPGLVRGFAAAGPNRTPSPRRGGLLRSAVMSSYFHVIGWRSSWNSSEGVIVFVNRPTVGSAELNGVGDDAG